MAGVRRFSSLHKVQSSRSTWEEIWSDTWITPGLTRESPPVSSKCFSADHIGYPSGGFSTESLTLELWTRIHPKAWMESGSEVSQSVSSLIGKKKNRLIRPSRSLLVLISNLEPVDGTESIVRKERTSSTYFRAFRWLYPQRFWKNVQILLGQ